MKKIRVELSERIYRKMLWNLKHTLRERYTDLGEFSKEYDKYLHKEIRDIERVLTELGVTQEEFDKI